MQRDEMIVLRSIDEELIFFSPKSYNLFPDFSTFTKCFPISALNKLSTYFCLL